ncbi:hypothetical protein [Flavobacterium sp. 25HG05S-40]|uniref:hypothetical protein n=1 Tax=Flavobacterium sp. 25HG05S-40 TaxID=3458682 RepID=UPI004043DC54
MKKSIVLSFLFLVITYKANAQKNWFTTYTDSVALVKDANQVSSQFTKDIKKIYPDMAFEVKTILHTTPYLIYFYKDTANLPLWEQVIAPQKSFFSEVAGGEAEGKKAFGLFFNGFYLPHELGHAFEYFTKGNIEGSYESEYFANTVAMLWWKKQNRNKELKECYDYAKKMWAKLPNPVPEGMTIEAYFAKNYEQASQDPYVYGYMQFRQFILIYEDKSLPDFDTFIQQNSKK